MKIKLNENFTHLSEKYLFSEISDRVERFKASGKGKSVISLGIGDVSLPISRIASLEMARVSLGLGFKSGFHGYADTLGDKDLRRAISSRYAGRKIELGIDEIFINDGAKSDLGGISDVLGEGEALICDPVYPVYLDCAIISGRRVRLLSANEENGFLPTPDGLPDSPFVIYLCSPNNPTGAVFTREALQKWVDFALESGSLIVFDAAYEAYISDKSLPRSIFECEGARGCAVEVGSFSKMAGFTGIRCGWTAIAKENPIRKLWIRRQGAKFNGASYVSQRGALASLSKVGARECQKRIDYYMKNASLLADMLNKKGFSFVGGLNAPYLWVKCPNGMLSWELFDLLLNEAQIVVTPGVGFGAQGEGYIRLSAFADRKSTLEAITRINCIL